MKAIKVQYTVREDFVETNKQNIAAVMAELRSKGNVGVMYSAYIMEDGVTFVHFVIQRDEAAAEVVPSMESFKKFQADLQTGVTVKPEAVTLDPIGASFEV